MSPPEDGKGKEKDDIYPFFLLLYSLCFLCFPFSFFKVADFQKAGKKLTKSKGEKEERGAFSRVAAAIFSVNEPGIITPFFYSGREREEKQRREASKERDDPEGLSLSF